MKPAWPIENWPAKPLTMLSDAGEHDRDADVEQELARERRRRTGATTCCSTHATHDADDERPQRARRAASAMRRRDARRASRLAASASLHTFSTVVRAEQAARLDEQHDDQDREHVDVAAAAIDRYAAPNCCDGGDQQRADRRAAHVADAADDRGDERREAEQHPRRVAR